jgi:hypothetical protein
MAFTSDRFEKDLTDLIASGKSLATGFALDTFGAERLIKDYKAAGYTDIQIEIIVKGSLAPRTYYQAWYSEALAVVKQVLPDRLQDFISHYEPARNRKELNWGSYVIKDALLGSTVTRTATDEVIVDAKAAIPHIQNQVAILEAAKARLRSSLFELRQLVQADVFDSEIEAARELLRNKFVRAAGAMAGVVLERHLRQACDDRDIKIARKNPGISDLNELLRSDGVIDVPQWRHISMLGDIRNLCSHNKAKEPTAEQVEDLIEGTSKVLKTIS